MTHQFDTKIVSYQLDGFADEVKTVEVDGKKFVADETDPTKPKLDDKQQPVPFTEGKKDDTAAPKIEDLSKLELAELAKLNPALAALLDEHGKLKTSLTKKEQEDKDAAEKALAEQGKWQDLANKRGEDLASITKERDQKEEQLGKYVETTKIVLDGLLKSIPKENLSLIPAEFSPRQQLEYIIKNADRLGAKVNAIDGKIDRNETTPTGTDEDKLMARITELTTKANSRTATNAELVELREAGSKLTQLRRAKEAGK